MEESRKQEAEMNNIEKNAPEGSGLPPLRPYPDDLVEQMHRLMKQQDEDPFISEELLDGPDFSLLAAQQNNIPTVEPMPHFPTLDPFGPWLSPDLLSAQPNPDGVGRMK